MTKKNARKAIDGATLLTDVHDFLARFVAYPSVHAHVAHTLWIAHSHIMGAWESTPRIAFLSPEPASGKTRALEISSLLVLLPVEAINVTPAYLFRKVGSEDGLPTILYDEIDTVFGPKAKEHEEVRALINAGHRKGAVAGRCVVRGATVFTEEIPAYCAVALAGLGWLPDTILSRSIIIRMRRRASDETIESFRRRVHAPEGGKLRHRLERWAAAILDAATDARPDMPPGVEDRNSDVWESLFVIADIAGGEWPQRARDAAIALVQVAREKERRQRQHHRPLARCQLAAIGTRSDEAGHQRGCPPVRIVKPSAGHLSILKDAVSGNAERTSKASPTVKPNR